MKTTRPAAALAAALALGLAGCGGDDDGLTKAEWITKADAICKEGNTKLNELGDPPQNFDQLAGFIAKGKAVAAGQVQKLKELETPSEIEDDVEKVEANLDKQLGKFDELQAAAKKNDAGAIQATITELDKLDTESDKLADEIGLKECGKDA